MERSRGRVRDRSDAYETVPWTSADLALLDEVSSGGSWPRHFAIDGGVLFAANQKGNSVVSFRFDAEGLPRPTGDVVELDSPTCVLPR